MNRAHLNSRPLWFEPFLQQVKKELGYPFDLGKYAQLLQWANDQPWSAPGVPMQSLYAVCRVMFLQDHEHEPVFQKLFFNYIVDELAYEQELVKEKEPEAEEEKMPHQDNPASETQAAAGQSAASLKPTHAGEPPDEAAPSERPEQKKRYLNVSIPGSLEDNDNDAAVSQTGSKYLLTDAWLPLTKREMLHGWRQLRKRESYVMSNRLDVHATVHQIAKEGILLKPVYEKEQVNSDDLLLILVDCKGSMVPFHHLSNKLVEAATTGGGHRNALVYYFYNYPGDVVYKNPTLTDPVPLVTLYSMIRPDHTNALILSDAGAARGNINKERIAKTAEFLYGSKNGNDSQGLHKSALFVVWINPMPRHRWLNTSAEAIAANTETPMFSLMDDGYSLDGSVRDGYLNFLHAVNKLMGR